METLSLNCPMTLYEDLCLLGLVDTRLDNSEPLEITSDPIVVAVLVGVIILDMLGEKL